ncbi:PepSY domain-containing protein [Tsuneonella sp. YG55]|uniref:PepSY domain-containing protein n=1 Tax=Tsuneonella litorea TaxID=2976475 RepID=A0A9X3ALD2_9SPHN|nr:PepSY domain-containing protein [Tsuneonella litorea]MCT2559113.1 PepSY domain-containing protein [Tsuneonella litorea]
MQRYARWHIWLGWLIAVPFLLWTVSGVLMVVRPIEEVRGTHLRIEPDQRPALEGSPRPIPFPVDTAPPVVEMRSFVQRGRAVTLVTASNGLVSRYDATTGEPIPALSEQEAREAIATSIRGGDKITAMRSFEPDETPFDFRRPSPVWQATLEDGTFVYINRASGEIEAVRTRWWRFYDFMWGLHIMDLQTREQPHNPLTVTFGILAIFGSLLGTVLLFRRRKARVTAPARG